MVADLDAVFARTFSTIWSPSTAATRPPLDDPRLQLGADAITPRSFDRRGLHGLAKDGLLKIAGTEVHGPAAKAVPVPPPPRRELLLRLDSPLAFRHAKDLRRVNIHEARIEHDVGLGLFMANPADPESAKTARRPRCSCSSFRFQTP